MLNRLGALAAFILISLAAAPAMAQGLIVPNEPDLPPLALMRHRVTVSIENQAATTTVEQIFQNNTERQLEAQYVFPIPRGAAMSKFTMLVNGKEKAGDLVEKTKARQIYNQIVNRAQDPGLLEYLGNEVFRANLFPILPRSTQTITLRFEQILPSEASLVSYTYPVRAGEKRGPTVQGEFTIDLGVKSPAPLQNLYSPSHAVDIVRKSEFEAQVSFRERHATLQKDFQLYYSVSDKDVGLNLVTSRPDAKEPGTFMMLVSPKPSLKPRKVVERDVVFVLDTSGSMSGEKIKQARSALKYGIAKLNDGDRFGLVKFSSWVDPWKKELVPAKENREAALKWVDTLLAEGGTDISGALDAALAFPRDPKRPSFIVFMTDGKPTIGDTTDPRRILAKVEKAKAAPGGESVRIFSWGVGYDLDTHLVDGIAAVTGGVSEYVRPEEDIAVKAAAFYNKSAQPVLTNLELKVIGDKVQLVNLMPRQIPDLYAGGQLVILGQYTGEGDVALRLTGRVNDETQTFDYEGRFPAAESRHAFIEPLWAKRRIGHLLDQIRLHGEKKELIDDVIRLSMEYGIQTPYTSYLILEDGTPVSAAPAGPRRGLDAATAGAGRSAEFRKDAAEKKLEELAAKSPAPAPRAEPARPAEAPADRAREAERQQHNQLARTLADEFKKQDGKAGVDVAGYLRQLKESDKETGKTSVAFKKAAGTRFYLYRGMWIDQRFEETYSTLVVKFGSEGYFRLVEARPELVEILKIGSEVVFVTASGKALVVAQATGQEKLDDARIADLFKAVEKK
jgi:Ca-activated chloride channel family protein